MKKVVSATLAGALAVGMVPAMALAADDADSIELQTLTGAEAFSQGKVTAAVDQDGNVLDLTKEIKLTYDNASSFYVVPTEVTPKLDAAVKVDHELYTVKYYDADGNQIGDDAGELDAWGNPVITNLGKYTAVVSAANTGTAETVYDGGSVSIEFELVAPVLEGASVFEVNDADLTDSSDVVFTYTGADYSYKDFGVVSASGKILEEGVDYTIGFRYDNGTGDFSGAASVTPKSVGNYAAKIVGKGIYAGQEIYIPFQIGAFDLGKVEGLTHPAIEAGTNGIAVNGFAALDEQIAGLSGVDAASYQLVPKTTDDEVNSLTEMGTYTYILKELASPADKTVSAGVTGQAEVSVDVVANALVAENFWYGTGYFGTDQAPESDYDMEINLGTVNPKLFDKDVVRVADANGKAVAFDIVVTNAATGALASVDDVNTPGVWNVAVKVSGKDNGYVYGGVSDILTVKTIAGAVDLGTSAAFKLNGQTTGSFTVTYDGNDVLDQISTLVMNGKKALVEGADYTVKVTKQVGSKQVPVTEIVDKGIYTLTLDSKTYSFSGNASITVTVDAVALSTVLVDVDAEKNGPQAYYTGEVVNPVAKFVTATGAEIAVDASAYAVTINSFQGDDGSTSAKEIKAAGLYQISIADANANDNFYITPVVSEYFRITEDGPYLDVPSDKWFADEVLACKNLGYMTGYYNGNTFGPYDSAERQDVAIVIGRMAGIDFDADFEGSVNNGTGYVSAFSDVVEGAYYAKAVQWADKAGIMTGYSANDEFGVNDDVTRQDLVVALYRYAQKYQKGFEPAEDVAGALAAYADGAEVSGYAKTAVAWAIEQGIMGVGTTALNPKADITRAELAAMTVRLQPEKLA